MQVFKAILFIFVLSSCQAQPEKSKNMDSSKWNTLNEEERRVIINKGTEYPFTGEYTNLKDSGVYHCKQCDLALFESSTKFNSGSGWPSFDDAISGAVKEITDNDGSRTEIVCSRCDGHLGHVFKGEAMTEKSTRHCVNSVSLSFEPAEGNRVKEIAYFASGCFWGTEYYLQKVPGVISTAVGYMGGAIKNVGYKEVCTGRTGHAEVVKVEYDPTAVSYETLAKHFFETHDPTQVDRQGPDVGTQYRSEVFYTSEEQEKVANALIKTLEGKGLKIATKVTSASEFWMGEGYHQDYYDGNGKTPYCHSYTERF